MRVSNAMLEEIIANDGCRRGSVTPINSTGVVRLAVDLLDARAQVRRLEREKEALQRSWESVGGAREDRANITGLEGAKRTKRKVT